MREVCVRNGWSNQSGAITIAASESGTMTRAILLDI